jgi:hypothetical protein
MLIEQIFLFVEELVKTALISIENHRWYVVAMLAILNHIILVK